MKDKTNDMIQVIQVPTSIGTTWEYEQPVKLINFPILLGSTYRGGGTSDSPYESFNLAFHVGDEAQAVLKNRELLAEYIGVEPSRLTCGHQVHGLTVTEITEPAIGAGSLSDKTVIADCDAIYTAIPGVPLLLFTADCVAVGIYDSAHHVIGVVHAGWKGAIGYLPNLTIEAMGRSHSTEPSDCYVFLGPSIGPQSFEVNEELAQRFIEESRTLGITPKALVGDDAIVTYITRKDSTQPTPHVNLWAFIKYSLIACGVPEKQIIIGGTDSMIDERCFSYRRESGCTGRMAMFGMLKKK